MPECWRAIALCVVPLRSPKKNYISISEYQNSGASTRWRPIVFITRLIAICIYFNIRISEWRCQYTALAAHNSIHIQADSHIYLYLYLYLYVSSFPNKE
jgi:hypothetical protein